MNFQKGSSDIEELVRITEEMLMSKGYVENTRYSAIHLIDDELTKALQIFICNIK